MQKIANFIFSVGPWSILIRVNDSSRDHQTSNIHVLLNIEMFDVRMLADVRMFNVRKFRNSRIFACFLLQMFEVRMLANFQIVRQTWTSIRTSNKNVQCSVVENQFKRYFITVYNDHGSGTKKHSTASKWK